MAGSSLRVALVGCGRISRNHFEAIASTPGVELSAVCDVIPERADAAARALGVPAFTSYEEMLRDATCDIVSVTTPSGLHPVHAEMAARSGKHVVCEKPMAISIEAADAMMRVCDEAGVRLFVVMQNRLNPAVQLLRRAIDKGRFGRIYTVNSTVRWTRPQEYYDQADWRGTWALDGGAIMNQASHYVDLMQWLAGPVESVMAYTATLARQIKAVALVLTGTQPIERAISTAGGVALSAVDDAFVWIAFAIEEGTHLGTGVGGPKVAAVLGVARAR